MYKVRFSSTKLNLWGMSMEWEVNPLTGINEICNLKNILRLLVSRFLWTADGNENFVGFDNLFTFFNSCNKHSTLMILSAWIFHSTKHMTWNLNLLSLLLYVLCFFFTSPNICFYIALDAEQIPYINHLMEKLMHMTVDIATSSSVGIDDSILVGDDKSHFDRWNVKKLLFLLR